MSTASASSLSPSFSVIAERFRRAGQIDRAIALCREGLAVHPNHLSARVTLGCALMDLGQDAEAHRELQMVLKRAPDNLAAIRGLAELHARGVDGIDAQEANDDAERHDREIRMALMAQEPVAAEMAPEHFAGATPITPLDPVHVMESAQSFEPIAAIDPVDMFASEMAEIFEGPAPSASLEPAPLMEFAQPFAVLESIDPVEPPAAAMVAETLDVPSPLAPMGAVLRFENAHAFELSASLDPMETIEDIDPVMEVDAVTPMLFEAPEMLSFDPIEPMQFEIEDVIDHADEPLDSPSEVAVASPVIPEMPVMQHAPQDAWAVPAQSAGPIAVLDEWLTRIRARRAELLSEYAAG